MKIVCIADQHGHFDQEVPECDLLILAGDMGFSASEAGEEFYWWLADVPTENIVAVGGNMDYTINRLGWPSFCPGVYLENEETIMCGLTIWGTPWVPEFAGAWTTTEDKLARIYAGMPEDTDVLVSHGPPHGYLDCPRGGRRHVGSKALLQRIDEVQPRLVVCGHIHDSYGEAHYGSTHIVNAAVARGNDPIVVEW